ANQRLPKASPRPASMHENASRERSNASLRCPRMPILHRSKLAAATACSASPFASASRPSRAVSKCNNVRREVIMQNENRDVVKHETTRQPTTEGPALTPLMDIWETESGIDL